MTREDFEKQMRIFLRQRPFQPFTVMLNSGDRIEVDVAESVAFDAGSAAYISEDGEITLFACEDVRQIQIMTVDLIARGQVAPLTAENVLQAAPLPAACFAKVRSVSFASRANRGNAQWIRQSFILSMSGGRVPRSTCSWPR